MVEYFCSRCGNGDVTIFGSFLLCPNCDLNLLISNFDAIKEEVNRLNEINRNLASSPDLNLDLNLINEKISILINLYRYGEATEVCENLFTIKAVPIIPGHIENILINYDVPDDIVCRLEILKAKCLLFLNTGVYKFELGEDELFEATKLYIQQSPNFDDDTLRCCDLLLKWEGNQKELFNVMADVYLSRKDYERALNYCNQSRIMDNNDFWTWFNKSRIYVALGDNNKALECGAIAINTENVDFKYVPDLFEILTLDYNSDNVMYLNELFQNYSNSCIEMQRIWKHADELFDNGNYYEAIIEYDRGISYVDSFVGIWFNKGMAHYNLQQYEEAIFCMDKVLELNEREPQALAMKSASLLATENYHDAKYYAKEALKYDKNDLTAKGILEFFKERPLLGLLLKNS